MKLRALTLLLLLCMIGAATPGCQKDDDQPGTGSNETEAPVIERISPTGTALSVAAGDNLVFTVRARDNAGLSQLRVNIHNDFDGHTHKTSTTDTLAVNEIHDLHGKADTTLALTIPTAATHQPGTYHVLVYALDIHGNSAQFLQYDLTLTNSLFPSTGGLTLNSSAPLHFDPCETQLTRNLSGTVNAGAGKTLADIHVVLRLHGGGAGHTHKTAEDEIELLHIHDIQAASYTFSSSVLTFDRSVLEDDHTYELLVEATDTEGRSMTLEVSELEAHISPDPAEGCGAKR
ncbi:MAG: DUF4625 domain-containing protein [Bacteroidetes bacterium]|nr:DUF4625 domain-containing protein [Bacteroidota bacterium]